MLAAQRKVAVERGAGQTWSGRPRDPSRAEDGAAVQWSSASGLGTFLRARCVKMSLICASRRAAAPCWRHLLRPRAALKRGPRPFGQTGRLSTASCSERCHLQTKAQRQTLPPQRQVRLQAFDCGERSGGRGHGELSASRKGSGRLGHWALQARRACAVPRMRRRKQAVALRKYRLLRGAPPGIFQGMSVGLCGPLHGRRARALKTASTAGGEPFCSEAGAGFRRWKGENRRPVRKARGGAVCSPSWFFLFCTRMRAVFRRDVDTICALHQIDGREVLYILLTYIKLSRRNPEQPGASARRVATSVCRRTSTNAV